MKLHVKRRDIQSGNTVIDLMRFCNSRNYSLEEMQFGAATPPTTENHPMHKTFTLKWEDERRGMCLFQSGTGFSEVCHRPTSLREFSCAIDPGTSCASYSRRSCQTGVKRQTAQRTVDNTATILPCIGDISEREREIERERERKIERER